MPEFTLVCARCSRYDAFRLTAPAAALANVMRKRHRELLESQPEAGPACDDEKAVLSIHLGSSMKKATKKAPSEPSPHYHSRGGFDGLDEPQLVPCRLKVCTLEDQR